MVLVPSPASWENRSDGINTIAGLKVLKEMRGHYVCHPECSYLKMRDQVSDLHRTTVMLRFCLF
jgi:hypothetical protein